MDTDPPWNDQFETINDVWEWSESQPAPIHLVVRALLARMVRAAEGPSARPLIDRVDFSYAHVAALCPAQCGGPDTAWFGEAMSHLSTVQIVPGALGRMGVRLKQGALFDIVKTHSGADEGRGGYWLVSGGQWSCIQLGPIARDVLCRIAWASLMAEPHIRSSRMMNVGLDLIAAGIGASAAEINVDLARFARPGESPMYVAAALASLEGAGLIQNLAYRRRGGQPETAVFSLRQFGRKPIRVTDD